jgi:hypothetical protein
MTATGSQPRRTRRRPSALAVVVGALGMLLAPVGPVSALPVCAHTTQVVKTFTVKATTPKKAYRVGQIVPVTVTVTRPGKNDPADLGVPLPEQVALPVEDANVVLGLYAPVGFPVGAYGKTNADGKVTLKVRAVTKLVRTFVLEARADKRYFAAPVGCVDPVEEGTVTQHEPFDVRPSR